ncbi:MAG: TonB-dependent receptor [Cyclobacteriaceae bacterium]
MKRNLQILIGAFALTFLAMSANAQNVITGAVTDGETGEGLPGANVLIKGTTNGTVTNLEGEFKLSAESSDPVVLLFSYVGYTDFEKEVDPSSNPNLGNISLKLSAQELSPLEIIASVAVERKTPVAVSSVKAMQIEEKASNQEFPELLKSTPGVYTTRQGGGYGDSRINVRGFNSVNVAVMINGIPVNDMENGLVYWSNWAGLTDVTKSMQVQRGLGASKVAVPSIGGTINIVTNSTDAEKGGTLYYGLGNNGYSKTSFSLSSGLMDNGWAVSLSGAKIEGDGWVDGTQFQGYNYFFNISKQMGNDHTLSLTGFGAPQRHGQRQDPLPITDFKDSPRGLKYNPFWGYKNGNIVNVEDNFYHKPQFSLNHYWTVDDRSELSTAVYMSFGTGGGGGTYGDFAPAQRGYEPQNLDALIDINQDTQDGNALAFLRASRNDHNWFGLLSTYNRNLTNNIDVMVGLDVRQYVGKHFREITDLLGADYWLSNDDVNSPDAVLGVGDKYSYNNDGHVKWYGGFLQAEYNRDRLNAFTTISFSTTGYRRVDHFKYLKSDQLYETDYANYFGYQVKGGVNYNLTDNHNVFANVGFFEKAPDFDTVYPNFDQITNTAAENQKVISLELGYGYRSQKLSSNVNIYRTAWLDRTFTDTFTPEVDNPDTPNDETDEDYFASLLGVDAVHQGIEIDFIYKPVPELEITGMASLGDWQWANDVDGITIFDDNQNEIGSFDKLYIDGLKVGDAAQTTAAAGVNYTFFPGFKVGANFNYFAGLYSEYDPTGRTNSEFAGVQPAEVPDYSTMDLNLRYDFGIGANQATFFGNVNNLFNTEYISEADEASSNIASLRHALVYYGIGTTWTVGLKYRF